MNEDPRVEQLMMALQSNINKVNAETQEFLEYSSLVGFLLKKGMDTEEPMDKEGFKVVIGALIREIMQKISESTDSMLSVVRILTHLMESDNYEVSDTHQES